MRGKAAALLLLLIGLNIAGWGAALLTYHNHPLLLGTAVLAYGFGLRHAFDIDHVATIDNVTRKLMHDGKRPLSAGFFFSMGHSTVVFAMTLLIAGAAGAMERHFLALKGIGGLIGTFVSAAFLLVIAFVNILVLLSAFRKIRNARSKGENWTDQPVDFPHGHSALAPFLQPLVKLVGRSWHMYPLGALFGLGFDTATEIGLLGLSAAQATQGLSLWTILIFPLLFAAAMSLADTLEGLVMLGAYGWAFVDPTRKRYYDLTITAMSVLIALAVGGIEAANVAAERLQLSGTFWRDVDAFGTNSTTWGLATTGLFIAAWLTSMAFRLNRVMAAPLGDRETVAAQNPQIVTCSTAFQFDGCREVSRT